MSGHTHTLRPIGPRPKYDYSAYEMHSSQKSREELVADIERLRALAAKYYILRDVINWQIKEGKRVPKIIKDTFKQQMIEIDQIIGDA